MTRRDQMVREGLRLLDAHGFEGLSMRSLAGRLGLQAASLYKHVRDKNELLEWIAEALCAEVPPLDARKPWRPRLRAMAVRFRRVLLSHRDGARVLAETAPAGAHRLKLIDQVLGAFAGAGFSPAAAVDSASVLNSYVVGFVLDETAAAPKTDPFADLSVNEYPHLTALLPALRKAPADRRFQAGLDALLAGFALRAPTWETGAPPRARPASRRAAASPRS